MVGFRLMWRKFSSSDVWIGVGTPKDGRRESEHFHPSGLRRTFPDPSVPDLPSVRTDRSSVEGLLECVYKRWDRVPATESRKVRSEGVGPGRGRQDGTVVRTGIPEVSF